MSKIVTVLGASGNVGKLLIPYLSQKGYKVLAVGRTKPNFSEQNVVNLAVDYQNRDSLLSACKGSHAVYALMGLEYNTNVWQEQWPPLVKSLIDVIEESKAKLVFFDNVYSYGLNTNLMTEETEMKACSKKGVVRQLLDEMILKAISDGKIEAVIAKSADFYGPGIVNSVLGERFFNLISTKNKIEWFGDPSKKHNFTYSLDIPPALEILGSSEFSGTIHLPTSPAYTGFGFQEILEQILKKPVKIASLSKNSVWLLGWFMPILKELHEMMYQNTQDYEFNSHKIMTLFPQLKITSYTEGMTETIKWFENRSNSQQ